MANFELQESGPKLVLGTAQFNTASSKRYGACNKTKLTTQQIIKILSKAEDLHIGCIDTGSGYGNVNEHLLEYYQSDIRVTDIGTKIMDMKWVTDKMTVSQIKEKIMIEIEPLDKTHHLDIVSFHSFSDYEKMKCRKALISLKNEGLINNIGVSVYYYWQIVKVIGDPDFDYIQIPFNILTAFNLKDLIIERKEKFNRPIRIDVRSIFLQGILLNHDYKYWKKIPKMSKESHCEFIKLLNKIKEEFGYQSMIELTYGYLKSFPWINGVIVGVDNIEQLQENYWIFQQTMPITETDYQRMQPLIRKIVNQTADVLDPTKWKK